MTAVRLRLILLEREHSRSRSQGREESSTPASFDYMQAMRYQNQGLTLTGLSCMTDAQLAISEAQPFQMDHD
jgi:hypothetical protein